MLQQQVPIVAVITHVLSTVQGLPSVCVWHAKRVCYRCCICGMLQVQNLSFDRLCATAHTMWTKFLVASVQSKASTKFQVNNGTCPAAGKQSRCHLFAGVKNCSSLQPIFLSKLFRSVVSPAIFSVQHKYSSTLGDYALTSKLVGVVLQL